LLRQGTTPIGSRRRRAALQSSDSIPFEQLPYQCFQEARKILLADRELKLKEIETMQQRLARQESLSIEEAGGAKAKKSRVTAMQLHLERLKILADINDPSVKRKFEDNEGNLLQS
jgi:large subunit ribosomal protein L35